MKSGYIYYSRQISCKTSEYSCRLSSCNFAGKYSLSFTSIWQRDWLDFFLTTSQAYSGWGAQKPPVESTSWKFSTLWKFSLQTICKLNIFKKAWTFLTKLWYSELHFDTFHTLTLKIWNTCVCLSCNYSFIYTIGKDLDMVLVGNLR